MVTDQRPLATLLTLLVTVCGTCHGTPPYREKVIEVKSVEIREL